LQAEASFLDQHACRSTYAVLARVSPGYPPLPGRSPTCYSPVRRSPVAEATFAHDLHVLSTPPAFILSQDQTLQFDTLETCQGVASNPQPAQFRKYFTLRTRRSGHRSFNWSLTRFLYLVFKEPALASSQIESASETTTANRPPLSGPAIDRLRFFRSLPRASGRRGLQESTADNRR
jgi:hypothetical protein